MGAWLWFLTAFMGGMVGALANDFYRWARVNMTPTRVRSYRKKRRFLRKRWYQL